ncbi:MAG TPA: M56 family metallopeptidase [Caulobacteraceae bacterium]|nr:M56 family metallopeptidase [Caulobacteraceae bacterium]
MSWELFLEAALKSAAVAGAALLALRLAGKRPASERAWIAHVGILLALVVPALAVFGPEWKVEALAAPAPAAPAPAWAVAPGSPIMPLAAEADTSPALSPASAGALALMAYVGVALTLLLGLIAGVARLLVLQHRASVLTDQPWLSALAHAQKRMGFKHGAALLVSEELSSPVSWGFFRPTILLSRAAVGAPNQAEPIIAHELAHVVRLDWANLLLARVGAALLWFNPLVWMLARQAHQLREEAADDAVLRGEVSAPDYASLLLGVARHESRGALLAANGVAPGRDSLKRRLVRVLDGGVARDPARPLWRLSASAAAIAFAAPLAAFTPVAATAPDAGPDPAAATGAALSPAEEARVALAAKVAVDTALADARRMPASDSDPDEDHDLDIDIDHDLDVDIDFDPEAGPAPGSRRLPKTRVVAQATVTGTTTASVASARISPETLASLKAHGVTPAWIASLETELPEIRRLPADHLVSLAVHRVSASWLRELGRAGYNRLTYDQVVSFAVHRIDAAYVREMASAGYPNLPADDLISFRVHGVNAAYVRELAEAGYRNLSADDLVGLRVHGVRAADVHALEAQGLTLPPTTKPKRKARQRSSPPEPPAPPPAIPN